ncbi:MAG: protein translocase subunit SecF [Nannocystaceae bacterium]
MQKFFELIPSGTNLGFVKNAWKFITLSIVLLVLSVGAMVYNSVAHGSVLNFGIDFQGGSTVRLAFSESSKVGVQDVRDALDEFGYEGAAALTVPDAANEILIRVKEVTSIGAETAKRCEEAVKGYPAAKLESFTYPEGSSKIFLKFEAQPIYGEVEKLMTSAGCEGKADKGVGKEGEFPVEVSLIGIGAKLSEQIDGKFGAGTVDHIVSSETVGAKVGGQLKRDGITSLLYAIGFIFLYVMLRFDLRFAPGGIVALAHDALMVVGAFALTYKEFNLQTIAALLTVIGYSINDTIVVFDRIRERVALNREADIEETTNAALNETLSRTILTSGTTMLVVASIWILGSGPIKDFAFALMVGLIVGTYSSLFIACPLFLWINRRFYGGEGHLIGAESEERPGTGTLLGSANNEEIDEVSGKTFGDIRSAARGEIVDAEARETSAGEDEDEEAASEAGDGGVTEAEIKAKLAKAAASVDDDAGEGARGSSRRRRRPRPS